MKKKATKQQTPQYGICLDWETSGATWGGDSSIDHQGLSFGAVVFSVDTLEPIKALHVLVKFDASKYKWTKEAENVHGMSIEYLEEHGVTQEDAAIELVSLIQEFFGTTKVLWMGHNAEFDKSFTRQLLSVIGFGLGEIRPSDETPFIQLHHVQLDTAAVGLVALKLYKSDLLFDAVGLEDRKDHNALEDALYTLETCRRIRMLVEAGLAA